MKIIKLSNIKNTKDPVINYNQQKQHRQTRFVKMGDYRSLNLWLDDISDEVLNNAQYARELAYRGAL